MMETLECTRGAVADAFMRVAPVSPYATYPYPTAQAAACQLLLPVRSHSMGGVRLHEVKDLGRDGSWLGSDAAKTGIDFTTFPTRLGPPPDHPPVN